MRPNTDDRDTAAMRHVAKFGGYQSSRLLRSLIQPKIVKKEPAQFTAALAHEVRNPLTNINLAAEMLKVMLVDEEQKVFLDIILRGSARINDLVADLLVSSQAIEIPREEHSVHQLLDEVIAMAEDRITLKNIVVRKEYGIEDCHVLVDKEKIKIALTNIVINAIDAMPSENGELTLFTNSVNGKCMVEIEDNGIGISVENLNNIFKPYFTNKPNGLGLGLSTTLEILRYNHVGVNVQSEPGSGTNFALSFEICPPAAGSVPKRRGREIA
jgi:signal transduction histidine kinase